MIGAIEDPRGRIWTVSQVATCMATACTFTAPAGLYLSRPSILPMTNRLRRMPRHADELSLLLLRLQSGVIAACSGHDSPSVVGGEEILDSDRAGKDAPETVRLLLVSV
jgi:hypothetical protein